MNAKELRIGNLVSRLDLGDNSLRIETVLEIKQNKVLTTGPISVNCLYSEIEPIPLTEEWKRKLGFTTETIDPYFVKSYTRIPEHIKYVHQIQNLYFALTGEDLQLK